VPVPPGAAAVGDLLAQVKFTPIVAKRFRAAADRDPYRPGVPDLLAAYAIPARPPACRRAE
jgi:hypothetical protein